MFNIIYYIGSYSMLKKSFLIFFVISVNLVAGKPKIHPMVKSAILPGWGESSLNNLKRAQIFRLSEISLITACISTYTLSSIKKSQYITFAVEHAQVDSKGKDHQYWVDIGNYQNLKSHNDEHLRFREIESLYSDNLANKWEWDSEKNRKEFESMRILSDRLAHAGKFIIGGIVINHMISSIDALYLSRIQSLEYIGFYPYLNPYGINELRLQVQLSL